MAHIKTLDALREVYAMPRDLVQAKQLDRLDGHCRAFLSLAPFCAVATQGADGFGDVTPRGDAPGFALVLDDTTLALPDRPGNNRLDTLSNIIENPGIGLLFLIPGFDDTLRINGTAEVRVDDDLRARFEIRNRLPASVILVRIREVYLHCAKAFIRSKLWDPDARVDRSRLPSLSQMLGDQINGEITVPTDPELAVHYDKTLY